MSSPTFTPSPQSPTTTSTSTYTSSLSFTPVQSFPTTWTAPTSCFATTNYYRVLLGGGYVSNMYGTPTPVLTGNTPTGACFPPSFTINSLYLTDGGCPTGYTRACATAWPTSNNQTLSLVTCCPSITSDVFSFMCKDDQYGCHATATPGVVWTGVITDIGATPPTEQPVTRTPSTEEGIEAWGVKLLWVPPVTTATTTPPQASSSNGSSDNAGQSSSLSAGAIAGVAIGAAFGVAILVLGAFLLYRHKIKRQKPYAPVLGSQTVGLVPKDEYPVYQLDAQNPPQQLDAPNTRPPEKRVWELPG